MDIKVRGAREHNLKNISLDIPRNKVVVFTGVSGSGKSSLVFDTIYAEAQRQYLETLGAYTRKRMPKFSRPEIDRIEGLSTAVVIDQKRLGSNPRSTVGTVTDVYTYLRLLFSRCGNPTTIIGARFFSFNRAEGACPVCKGIGEELVLDKDQLINWEKSLNEGALHHSEYKPGSRRLNIIKISKLFDMNKKLKSYSKKELETLLFSDQVKLTNKNEHDYVQSYSFEGVVTGILRRRSDKRGLHISYSGSDTRYFQLKHCSTCDGSRLNKLARSVKLNNTSIATLTTMQLTDLYAFLETVKGSIAKPIIANAREVLSYLIDIGVGYLSLDRSVATLSGGESQRVKMARQLGSTLIEQLYILDEPTTGLHPKDIDNLTQTLFRLRDKENSILVVEHDPSIIKQADHVVEIGPRAGKYGGNIMFEGTVQNLLKSKESITAHYLKRKRTINKKSYRTPSGFLTISNASLNNLKNITVNIPMGVFVSITGVAGSGKSTLINDTFVKEHPESIVIDQSGVGKNVRSCPATYIGIFDLIRQEFALANNRPASLFSFNSLGGCKKCKGLGHEKIEMMFLDEVVITCEECHGKRYNDEVLAYRLRNKTVAEVLSMSAHEAVDFFDSKEVVSRLELLTSVGLDYLTLGQPLNTLSGGEAQRIKLVSQLYKQGNIYVLDEPTTGLHMADIEKLLRVLNRIVDKGNTVIVIEHNLDIIAQSDWIIDLGPYGGDKGGEVIAEGTREDIAQSNYSFTGEYLRYM